MLYGDNGLILYKDAEKACGDNNVWVVRDLARKLGIARKFGRNNVIYAEDMPALRIGLLALGYKLPPPPVVEEATA
jgi:hypothetical protein